MYPTIAAWIKCQWLSSQRNKTIQVKEWIEERKRSCQRGWHAGSIALTVSSSSLSRHWAWFKAWNSWKCEENWTRTHLHSIEHSFLYLSLPSIKYKQSYISPIKAEKGEGRMIRTWVTLEIGTRVLEESLDMYLRCYKACQLGSRHVWNNELLEWPQPDSQHIMRYPIGWSIGKIHLGAI